ncbi:MAG: phosphotransferase [Pirellulales bacterium]
MDHELAAVLAEYDEFAGEVTLQPWLGRAGFSGADVWQVASARGRFAVRRWPPGQPNPPRRAWLHRFLRFVRDCGLDVIAAPLKTRSGATFVERGGRSWEVAPWLPGVADFHAAPSAARLAAAASTLAHFHELASRFPPGPARGPSPGLADRSALLQHLLHGEADRLREAVLRHSAAHVLAPVALRLLDLFPQAVPRVAAELARVAATPVPLFPCLRDIWHDHVLFTGDRVTGLIDYGALRTDTAAGDVARLLGSLVGDDPAGWQAGCAAYASRRAWAPGEQELLTAFDQSAVLLAGLQWVRWVFVDEIHFGDLVQVEQRMNDWAHRLARLIDQPRENCTFPFSR